MNDSLSPILGVYGVATPPGFAVRVLARLLEQERQPDRRRALLQSFEGQITLVPGGMGFALQVLTIAGHSVSLRSTDSTRRPDAPPASPSEPLYIFREPVEDDIYLGVGP